MAKKKSNPKSPFTGRWRIVSMSAWEDEYLDEEVQAFFEFEETGSGSFQFGYIQGLMDCRTTSREGKPAVEFSWEGGDGADGTPLMGRGWAILQGDELSGLFCIHEGDDSEFVARKADQPPPKSKKPKRCTDGQEDAVDEASAWATPNSMRSKISFSLPKAEQGGSALVPWADGGWKTSGVRSKIESATIPEGKSHVQEEDFTKRPMSMRERKEVQELLLW